MFQDAVVHRLIQELTVSKYNDYKQNEHQTEMDSLRLHYPALWYRLNQLVKDVTGKELDSFWPRDV